MSARDAEAAERAALRARHEAIYGPAWVRPLEHWRVAPRIVVGRNPLSELDVLELVGLGVTHVLDLRQEREWTSAHGSGVDAVAAMARHGLVRKNVPIRDYTPPLAADFDAAAAWLDEVFADEAAQLYAHCRVGIQRTPTILAAWLALRDGGSAADAVLAMRRYDRYPGLPLPDQLAAAERWLAARREAS